MRADIFCRVIDNFGDIGVCWRLARQLAHEYNWHVRLWVDDLASFRRLEPTLDCQLLEQHIGGVNVLLWAPIPTTSLDDVATQTLTNRFMSDLPDVLIEAFACDPPEAFIRAMRDHGRVPLWLNLEYLSAEAWVDSCHEMQSIRPDGLKKVFYFPGFRPTTGGLLREQTLLATRDAVQSSRAARVQALEKIGLASLGAAVKRDAKLVFLFCYADAPLAALVHALDQAWQTTIVIAVPQGVALGLERETAAFPHITVTRLDFLPQADFDVLLWCADLNVVRGEDSFVRAIWAARPFIWHIYPQEDEAHLLKLDAWLEHNAAQASSPNCPPPPSFGAAVRAFNQRTARDDLALQADFTALLSPPAWLQWTKQAGSVSDFQAEIPTLAHNLVHYCLNTR